jgi:hypothetical protein
MNATKSGRETVAELSRFRAQITFCDESRPVQLTDAFAQNPGSPLLLRHGRHGVMIVGHR